MPALIHDLVAMTSSQAPSDVRAPSPPSCPECLFAATRREPARLRRVYHPADAPSLLSVEAHSSVLRPSVLRSFKLALLKGKRSLPAITSPQKGPLNGSSGASQHLPRSPLAKLAAPLSSCAFSSLSAPRSSAYSNSLPISPPRLSLSASNPLPEPSHVLHPKLKRSAASLSALPSSSNKRQRPSAVALPLPARDVVTDKELAALWIARELVEWSGQYKIVDVVEGAEEDERSAVNTPQSLESMEEDSSDAESCSSDSASESESSSCHLSVHVEDETGQQVSRWLSASQLQERELARQTSLELGKPHPAGVEQLPDGLPSLERPDSLESVESVPLNAPTEEHDGDEEESSEQQMMPPPAAAFCLPLPSSSPSVSIPVLSAESLLHTLRASFESKAGESSSAAPAVKTYMPHPLSMLQAASSSSAVNSSSASAMSSSAFTSPTASSLSYYVAPSMSSFSSALFSSSFTAPPPSSPLVLKSVTLPLSSLSSSFSFPYLTSPDPRSSFSLYPTAAAGVVVGSGVGRVASPSAVALSSGGSFSMTSPFHSLMFGRDVSVNFSLA